MRKFLSAVAILIFSLSFALNVEAARKVVAVMPLENVSGYSEKNVAEIMTEQIIVALQNSGQYTVSERLQMGTVLKEQGFQNLTSDDPVEMGAMSSADYSVIGKVTMASVKDRSTENVISALAAAAIGSGSEEAKTKAVISGIFGNSADAFTGSIELDVRFVDNRTGEVIFAKSFGGSQRGSDSAEALNGACKVAAENFLRELQTVNPFTARVADIYGENIYIDQGLASGLKRGDVLLISRETDPIVVNGKIIGMKQTAICTATVIEVTLDYAICRTEGTNYLVKKGDIVKRG